MTNTRTINIAKDFSETPGARYVEDGDFSAEEFYNTLLKPKFEEAIRAQEVLTVELDGTYGYASTDFGTSHL